jgi:hypothetical protein
MRAIVTDRPGSFRVTGESASSFTPDSLLKPDWADLRRTETKRRQDIALPAAPPVEQITVGLPRRGWRTVTPPHRAKCPAADPSPALPGNPTCEATSLAYAIRRIDDCTLAAIRPTERNARCWS